MWRSVVGIIIGNLAWTLLWLALNVVLRKQSLLPADPLEPVDRFTPLVTMLVSSVLFSVAAGWVTTAIARVNSYAPAAVLALIQLGLGIFFQAQAWHLMPLWYHVPFLLLLIPATLLGAWFRLRQAGVRTH